MCGQSSREEVPSQDEINKQLKASIVEDDVDPTFFFAGLFRFEKVGEARREVVDQDVGLCLLAGFAPLEGLDVFIREGREQR